MNLPSTVDQGGETAVPAEKDLAAVCGTYSARLLPIARRDLPTHAEDLVQATLLNVVRGIRKGQFRGEGGIAAYIHRIYKNTRADFLRVLIPERNSLPVDGLDGRAPVASSNPFQEVYRRQQRRLLRRAFRRLTRPEREILLMVDIFSLSYHEVSKLTGLPEGTVGRRLHESRRKLISIAGRLNRPARSTVAGRPQGSPGI